MAPFKGYALLTLALCAVPIESSLRHGGDRVEGRELAVHNRYKIAYPECVEWKLTVEQCVRHIRKQMFLWASVFYNSDITMHNPSIPGPGGVVSSPPPSEILEEYYFRYDVATNYRGETLGLDMDGQVHYGKPWKYHDGNGVRVRKGFHWDCAGLNSIQCAIHVDHEIPPEQRTDVHGNDLAQWVREQKPTPYHTLDALSYCTWEFDPTLGPNGGFVAIDVSYEDWRNQHAISKGFMSQLMDQLDQYQSSEASTSTTTTVIPNDIAVTAVHTCHHHLRSLPDAGRICTDIGIIVAKQDGADVPVTTELEALLKELSKEVDRFKALTFEIMYTVEVHGGDPEGSFVAEVPRVGQSPSTPDCYPGMKHLR